MLNVELLQNSWIYMHHSHQSDWMWRKVVLKRQVVDGKNTSVCLGFSFWDVSGTGI